MSDHPPENTGLPVPDESARSLTDILAELGRITGAQHGEAAAMRTAVSELSGALAHLFEMVRTDRAEQRARIAELEAALSAANANIRRLEAGERTAVPAPPPNDFGQLRDAAERLRQRTEELFRDAGTPLDRQRREAAEAAQAAQAAPAGSPSHDEAAAPSGDAPPDNHAAAATGDASADAGTPVEDPAPAPPQTDDHAAAEHRQPQSLGASAGIADEPFGKPGILRIFPGAVLRPGADEDFDVESELDTVHEEPRRMAAYASPLMSEAEDSRDPATGTAAPATPEAGEATDIPAEAEAQPSPSGDAPAITPKPAMPHARTTEPVAIAPRPGRRRRGLRRRKIDARKLAGVEPTAALRAMVSAVDDLWTAGHPLDLVIALTDGGTIHIGGGDIRPLRVTDVEPGMPARCTVTATSAQIVPLFGRLELTADQSAPLIHGLRRDADLLVGWIDRAQRLTAEPL